MDFLDRDRRPATGLEEAGHPAAPVAPGPLASGHGIATAREALESLDAQPSDPLDEFFYRPDESPGDLPELHAGALQPAVPQEAPRRLLAFELAGEAYAVDLGGVREIVKVPELTEVPRAPASVRGLMSLRGEVLPVVDLRLRLGLAETPSGRRARILVVEAGGGRVGVLVDAVAEVIRLKASAIEPVPAGFGKGADGGTRLEAALLAGICRTNEQIYVLLDLAAALESLARSAQ